MMMLSNQLCAFFLLKGIHSRVRFQSEESESKPASDRRHVQPLLGYDWIAGVCLIYSVDMSTAGCRSLYSSLVYLLFASKEPESWVTVLQYL